MTIHCAWCGRQISYRQAWYEPQSRTRVCSKLCLQTIRRAYAALVARREGRSA